MKPWTRIDPTAVNKLSYRTIIAKTFRLPDGSIREFGTKDEEGSEAVGVIALTESNQVVIVRLFRPGPEQVMEEIPGGGMEAGETPLQAAARELQEETGYQGTFTYLGEVKYDAYTNTRRHYVMATGCARTTTGQKLDHEERSLEVVMISIETLIANARAGRMTDPGAVLLAYDILRKMQGTRQS
ncbi:MAG TPA: NUDIX hydrolase [Patescibacteria group bacterium]|nr:NUDIX hydrolase [Patescibacteria group bacterium]